MSAQEIVDGIARSIEDAYDNPVDEFVTLKGTVKESLAGVVKLIEAAQLAERNFARSCAGDNFLGDDDHEAWTGLRAALRELEAQK